MTDFFDTTGVRDEPERWDALAKRITAHAVRRTPATGVAWLARSRAGWIAAALLLFAAVWSIASRPTDSADWARAFAPTDAIGSAMGVSGQPPSMGALLLAPGGG